LGAKPPPRAAPSRLQVLIHSSVASLPRTCAADRPFGAGAYARPAGRQAGYRGGMDMRRLRFVLVSTAICMLVLSSSVSASSSVVADRAGDAVAGSPAYVDIVQSKITDQVGRD